MFDNRAHVHTHTIDRVCTETGVQPPAGYLEALAAADTLRTNLSRFSTAGTTGELIDCVFTCVQAGEHPADSEQVRRLLVMSQLQNMELHRQADTRAKATIGDAVARYADDLIALWHKATADDGATLIETATRNTFANVANLDGMSPGQLHNVSDYKQFTLAASAARRLDAAASGFASMLSATRLSHPTGYATLILAAGIGPDELAAVNAAAEHGRRPDAWTLARHGITPVLCASLGDFAAACGQVSAMAAARDDDEATVR